jgi:hypothetical protein
MVNEMARKTKFAEDEKTKLVGNEIARSNRMFIKVSQVGELDAKGRTLFSIGFKGRHIAKPDRPLSMMVGIIHEFIVTKFSYSSAEECANDIAILKGYVNNLLPPENKNGAQKEHGEAATV